MKQANPTLSDEVIAGIVKTNVPKPTTATSEPSELEAAVKGMKWNDLGLEGRD